jgi:hypothetical protein
MVFVGEAVKEYVGVIVLDNVITGVCVEGVLVLVAVAVLVLVAVFVMV